MEVTIELPGFGETEVKVELSDSALVIRGESRSEREDSPRLFGWRASYFERWILVDWDTEENRSGRVDPPSRRDASEAGAGTGAYKTNPNQRRVTQETARAGPWHSGGPGRAWLTDLTWLTNLGTRDALPQAKARTRRQHEDVATRRLSDEYNLE